MHFKTKEEKDMKEYVGCMIKKEKDEIFLHQTNLIEKLEKEFKEELNEIKEIETLEIAEECIDMTKSEKKSRQENAYKL